MNLTLNADRRYESDKSKSRIEAVSGAAEVMFKMADKNYRAVYEQAAGSASIIDALSNQRAEAYQQEVDRLAAYAQPQLAPDLPPALTETLLASESLIPAEPEALDINPANLETLRANVEQARNLKAA